jgi:phosphatidylglycerophosphatase A
VSTPDVRRAFRLYPFSTLLATGLGVGLFPLAPGTAGSALGVVAAWLLAGSIAAGRSPSVAAVLGLLVSGLAVAAAGIPLSTRAFRGLRAKDPGCVVVDEVAGQLLASSPVPLFLYPGASVEACVWIASFLTFRLFDIWKPGPLRRSQELPEGVGVVVDDVLGGLLAAGATAALAWALSGPRR